MIGQRGENLPLAGHHDRSNIETPLNMREKHADYHTLLLRRVGTEILRIADESTFKQASQVAPSYSSIRLSSCVAPIGLVKGPMVLCESEQYSPRVRDWFGVLSACGNVS